MTTRLPPLLDRAILFAHRGDRARSRADTIAAFEQAVQLGATGVHVDAWTTGDGYVVIDRRGFARRFPRRRIGDLDRADLPDSFVDLSELFGTIGPDIALSVAVTDFATGVAVTRAAEEHSVARETWLSHADMGVLGGWRDEAPGIRLVNVTTLDKMERGPERRAAELAAARIDAVSLPENDWSGGMVTLFHRFGVLAFAAGAHYERQLARVIDMGIDAVVGDHADRMAAVAATFARS